MEANMAVQNKVACAKAPRAFRRAAIGAGVLYILGTAAGIASVVAGYGVLGAFFMLAMGMALAGVAVLVYPVLKQYNETLAMGYAIFRGALETATYIITAVCWLLCAALTRAAGPLGAGNADLQILVHALTDPRAPSAVTAIFFIAGAVMFYSLLYRHRLVPRWISLWGLLAAAPYIASALLMMFGAIRSGSALETALYMPMAVQEMVLAVWLIVKGFSAKPVKECAA